MKVTENLYLKNRFEKQILKKIKQSELIDTLKLKSYKRKDNYSDLTYYILKQYLEAAHNTRLDFLVEDKIYSQLGLYFTTYNPKNKYSKDIIVPSEVDSYYRHTTLQGDVHDMGAAMLGGVGGHAGIFSNAYEVAIIMQMYLQKSFYNNKKLFSKSTKITLTLSLKLILKTFKLSLPSSIRKCGADLWLFVNAKFWSFWIYWYLCLGRSRKRNNNCYFSQ